MICFRLYVIGEWWMMRDSENEGVNEWKNGLSEHKNGYNMSEWEKRNVIEKERVDELINLYKDIGFEVLVEDFKPEKSEKECSECMKVNPGKYKVIYTRKVKSEKWKKISFHVKFQEPKIKVELYIEKVMGQLQV